MRFAGGTVGTLAAIAFGVAASVVLNRLLGVEGRGAYVLAVKVAGLVVAWSQWGMPEVMLYFYGQDRERQGTLLGTALLVVAISSVIGGAIFFALYPLLADTVFRGVTPFMFAVAVVSSIFVVTFMILRRVVQLRGQLLLFNLLDVSKSAVFVVLVVVFVFLLANDTAGAVVAFLSAEVLLAVAAAVYVWTRVERGWRIDLRLARQLMTSGMVVQVGAVAIFLAGQLGPYIVNVFGTLTEVGYYATALGVATYVTSVSIAVRAVLQSRMPALSGQREALGTLTVVVGRHALIWLLVVALAMALIAKPAIVFLYGEEFAPAYEPLLFILPGMVFYGVQQIIASYFIALRMYRTPALGAWVVAVVGLGLQIAAMPLLGLTGAAAALSVGYAASFIFYLIVFTRSAQRSALEFIPGLDDARYYLGLAQELALRRGFLIHSR